MSNAALVIKSDGEILAVRFIGRLDLNAIALSSLVILDCESCAIAKDRFGLCRGDVYDGLTASKIIRNFMGE